MTAPVIAVTSGEPAGIGPDICLALAKSGVAGRLVIVGDRTLLQDRARRLGVDIAGLDIRHVPLRAPVVAGRLDATNASYVLDILDVAIDGCISGEYAAMVTAPVHKGVINDAGVAFTGHTEYLAERTGTRRVVMMLAGTGEQAGLRVALATTHLPLREVCDHITPQSLEQVLRILHGDLRRHFGISDPHVLVAGLNPHAGEGGHLGREEIDVIVPCLERLRAEGMKLSGPLPADTLFTPRHLEGADAVLAMYHDQGLPVLKYKGFGQAVNITLGLPIIRTSVDHGTALDLAGTGKADTGSLCFALQTAREMASRSAALRAAERG